MAVKPIPEGMRTITPALAIEGADKAIDFYKRAFGAEERCRLEGPGGKIAHAELRIGDSALMLSEVFPQMGATATKASLMLYVTDCDAAYTRAINAGAKSLSAPANMFWGDRYARLEDPYGQLWGIATQVEDVGFGEVKKRYDEMLAKKGGPC